MTRIAVAAVPGAVADLRDGNDRLIFTTDRDANARFHGGTGDDYLRGSDHIETDRAASPTETLAGSKRLKRAGASTVKVRLTSRARSKLSKVRTVKARIRTTLKDSRGKTIRTRPAGSR